MADTFTVKLEGLDQILRRFDSLKVNVPRIVAAAANSTASRVKTLVARDVMAKWNIANKQTVLNTMTVTKATTARPSAEIKMQSRGISFAKFKTFEKVKIQKTTKPKYVETVNARTGRVRRRLKTKKYNLYGVRIALLRGDSPEIVEHAFPARMPSGHRGAFQRIGKPRLPIREKKSISPTSMWADYIDAHIREASPYLRARVVGQLQSLLAKQGRT